MHDLIAAQARLHNRVDQRFALPANSQHTDMISKWAHDNIVLDWDLYAAGCDFPYCDEFERKGVAVRLAEFLAVIGGLWSIVLVVTTGLHMCTQRLLGLNRAQYAWADPFGSRLQSPMASTAGIV